MITIQVEEREAIEQIIRNSVVCYVGMVDSEGLPYVLPMNFGFEDDVIYLHSAQEGLCVDILKNNPAVCITFCDRAELVYHHEQVACSYRMKSGSVICHGQVEFVEDFDQKIEALDILMRQYTDRHFTYSVPAVKNVCVWKVEIQRMSSKQFGAPNPNSRNYKDRNEF